jgi:hypothetical protein
MPPCSSAWIRSSHFRTGASLFLSFAKTSGKTLIAIRSWAWLLLLTAQNLAERVEIARHFWQN